MDFKKIRKNIDYLSAWFGLAFCSFMVKFVPQQLLYDFAQLLGSMGYIIANKQRKIALESLGIAFGNEKSGRQIRRIAKDCFIGMAKAGVELLFLMERPNLLRERVQIAGEENLRAALSKGKGIILVSAHFGNFPLMLVKLKLEGYDVAGLMRPMRDSRVERFFMEKRVRFGIKVIYSIPRRECVENSLKALRNNELIFIPLDQNFGTGGVFVDFFAKKAATATGPVVLGRRTGAAILPCFIVRQDDNTHKIIFEPELELEDGKDEQEGIVMNVQKITNIIESYIRRYPGQWGWIHKRWKSTPPSSAGPSR